MAWLEIMLPSARTLPTGKLTQNPIRTGERRCILYVGDDSGITLAWDHATQRRPLRSMRPSRPRAASLANVGRDRRGRRATRPAGDRAGRRAQQTARAL